MIGVDHTQAYTFQQVFEAFDWINQSIFQQQQKTTIYHFIEGEPLL